MNKEQIYRDKKFTAWNISRVMEALSNEWESLHPIFEPGAKTAYSHKSNRISFKGEINVTLDFIKDTYPAKNYIQITDPLSLSPNPNDLNTHVLNTLNLGMFLGGFPELAGSKLFVIRKDEPWEGSFIQTVAQRGRQVIEKMLKFETCFHLLLDDEYEVGGIKLNSKALSLTYHLNQVKAYRLAEIYGHPEKLDEAIEVIKRFARLDEITNERLIVLYAKDPKNDANWLYTTEFLERLQASKV